MSLIYSFILALFISTLFSFHSLARESIRAEKSDKGYRLLGEVLLAQNKNREALEAFSQSLEMNPRQEFCLNKGKQWNIIK